jgi:hypothetical protein
MKLEQDRLMAAVQKVLERWAMTMDGPQPESSMTEVATLVQG